MFLKRSAWISKDGNKNKGMYKYRNDFTLALLNHKKEKKPFDLIHLFGIKQKFF